MVNHHKPAKRPFFNGEMMIEQGIRKRQERWLSAYDAGMSTRPVDIHPDRLNGDQGSTDLNRNETKTVVQMLSVLKIICWNCVKI